MKKNTISLQIVNPGAAGIDVGSRTHVVAVDQNVENVCSFGVYTKDHHDMIAYLRNHNISTVAMESTGSYWQTLFSDLQSSGFEVILVSGSQTKNVKGKKTDVIDAIWIQKLHSLGLLSGSFLPNAIMQELRTYYNHRQHLIEQIARYTLKMQKSLRLMNVRLDVALRDITGRSGMNIIEAILAGQRDPLYLSTLVDIRTKKAKEEIANSLHGTWRPELLFELKACLDLFHHFNKALTECDEAIEKLLVRYTPERTVTKEQEKLFRSYNRKKSKNAPAFNIARTAYQFFRTDLFAINGVSHNTVLCLMTNLGDDIYKFPTAKSFASWLRLVPNNKISGGRILSSKVKKGKNTIATALRHVANSIGNQKDHDLLPFFKRIAFRKGRVAAITATARKIATILWNMIVKAEHYSSKRIIADQEKFRKNRLKQVQKNIHNLKLSQEEMNQLMQRCLPKV
ncbi:IS110 family transposase [Sphingobacterium phlebotomi]|uniref:IS110 family transposase n=1 Tax=Sphingobacterium phlebotomi TaxID=2605433 RepID=A0A5D4H9C9_9SPHI|nr:IS110 family transposase [Sphingobacterium phlebotomi]TYR37476.1 IS110 family transposase [Sphingobacterium phlebotomi]